MNDVILGLNVVLEIQVRGWRVDDVIWFVDPRDVRVTRCLGDTGAWTPRGKVPRRFLARGV